MPRKPRRRSFGSITERERGKRYVLRWMENTERGRRRVSRTVRGTYAEASRELARIQCERSEDKPTMTLGEVYEKWYLPWMERRVAEGRIKRGTLDGYKQVWACAARGRWDDVPVDKVSVRDVQDWLDALTGGIANMAIVLMRGVMGRAVHYELVDVNKFKNQYEMPTRAAYRHPKDVYTLDRAAKVLGRIGSDSLRAACILACFGSARVGESLGVRAAEVQRIEVQGVELAAVPIVRRMPKRGSGPLPDGDLKNPQSVRTLLVPPPWSGELLEIARARIESGAEWLCERPDGLPLDEVALNRMWREEAGGDWIPFRNLRNSWRTFAQYEWHVDGDTLESLMGHAKQGVTGKHYLRPSVEQLADAFVSGFLST